MSFNYLQSANQNLVIDIESTGGIASGSPLQALTKKTESNQWWTTLDVPGKPGYFWIVSAVDNLVIDISETGGVKSGSALQALVQKAEDNQYWTTKDVPGQPGYFWLVSANQNLVIDISETGGVKSGSTLQALIQKNETNQYWKWVTAPVATPPAALGSNSNYYLYAGLNSSGGANFIQGIAVIIDITQDIVGTPPMSFQLNAYSPKPDLDAWQQYGISMAPGSSEINSFAENWPLSGANLFNIEPDGFVSLPNQTTIPAGWQITIQLAYSPGSYNVSGATCKVISAGKTLGVQTISLIGQPLAAGGTITESDLAPIVAYQLNLVGWANKVKSALSSGAGYITYMSSTPVTALNGRPADAESNYITAETSNSIYSVVPSGSSKSVVQRFGVSSAAAEIVIPGALPHTRISRFKPVR
jgi:hypothetical protein